MSEVEPIIKRILELQEFYTVDLEDPQVKKEARSNFFKMKRKVKSEIDETRELINKRNGLIEAGSNRRLVIEMNSSIRYELNQVLADFNSLGELIEQENKSRRSKLTPDEKQFRTKVITELLKEIMEIKKDAEEKVMNDDDDFECKNDDIQTIPEDGKIPSTAGGEEINPELTEEQKQALAQIQQNDKEIDEMINIIGDGLDTLKDIATNMGDELKKQEQKINDIDKNMDTQQEKLDKNNKELNRLLDEVKKEDHFCRYLVMMVLIVAVGLTLYNMLK